MRYKVGDKLQLNNNVKGLANFAYGEIYEIAMQKKENGDFLVFNDYDNEEYFNENELESCFIIINASQSQGMTKSTNESVIKEEVSFIKHDLGKIKVSLVEPDFILGVAEVASFGAKKYQKDNWKKCEDLDRYKDAALRHLLAYLKAEKLDEETGLSHLHHIACNLMFLDYFDRKEQKELENL